MLKRIAAVLALCFFVGFGTVTFVDVASAQDKKPAKTIDKKKATKRGVKGALAEAEEKEGPSKIQMGVGFGSVIVAYAVVKWL